MESHNEGIIRAIVIHCVATLLTQPENKLAKVFVDILLQPTVLQVWLEMDVNHFISIIFLNIRILLSQLCIVLKLLQSLNSFSVSIIALRDTWFFFFIICMHSFIYIQNAKIHIIILE